MHKIDRDWLKNTYFQNFLSTFLINGGPNGSRELERLKKSTSGTIFDPRLVSLVVL